MRAVLAALALLLVLAPPAVADPHLPPRGAVFTGVASGDSITDFTARTGRKPAIWQHWIQWGGAYEHAFRRSAAAGTRTMLHLSTAAGQHLPGRITPLAVARGRGDRYLLRLNARLAELGEPVYLRLLAEMNNCDLAYSSHDCSGRRRGRSHSPASFRQAWRRIVLILRGGEVETVDARLRAIGLPPLTAQPAGGALPRPQVAILWSPMTGGSPMIDALRPDVFWPGAEYVDWVSTSFYSRYPNFHYLEPFYRSFADRFRKPFAFGEWAMWGGDDPAFAHRLFAWVRSHDRVRMLVYNQGKDPAGPFRLRRFPRAQRVIRNELNSLR